jgi:hypothetical protein
LNNDRLITYSRSNIVFIENKLLEESVEDSDSLINRWFLYNSYWKSNNSDDDDSIHDNDENDSERQFQSNNPNDLKFINQSIMQNINYFKLYNGAVNMMQFQY